MGNQQSTLANADTTNNDEQLESEHHFPGLNRPLLNAQSTPASRMTATQNFTTPQNRSHSNFLPESATDDSLADLETLSMSDWNSRVPASSPDAGHQMNGTKFLRDLPTQKHFFYSSSRTHEEQITLHSKLNDRRMPNGHYGVHANEVMVMTLNEIAVEYGDGFFCYYLQKSAWQNMGSSRDGGLVPPERRPNPPVAELPNMLYMEYTWSSSAINAFTNSSQRSRWLTCDAMLNPPADATPVLPIQYCSPAECIIYVTRPDSIVIVASNTAYYIVKASVLGKMYGVRSGNNPRPHGLPSRNRIELTKGSFAGIDHRLREKSITAVAGRRDLYRQIRTIYRTGEVSSSSFGHVNSHLPRASGPFAGIVLAGSLKDSDLPGFKARRSHT